MCANPNSDHQLIVNQAGELEPDPKGPRSWDGEPLYSAETVQEGLFTTDAFRQYKGQIALEPAMQFRFIPDRGEIVEFEAETEHAAQEIAAERFHGISGATFQVLS